MNDQQNNSLQRLLRDRSADVCRIWLERALSVYSSEYGRFVGSARNDFANPVGMIFRQGLAQLFEALLDGAAADRCRTALEPMIRLRAVQDMPPSHALAFIVELKDVIRKTLHERRGGSIACEEKSLLDARIDRTALLAFDLYAESRESIFALRINEMKRNTAQLRRRPRPPARESDEACRLSCSPTLQPDGGCC